MTDFFSKKFMNGCIGFGEWTQCEDGKVRLDVSQTEKMNFEFWLVQLPPELVPVAREAILRSVKRLNAAMLYSLMEIKNFIIDSIIKEILKMKKSGDYFRLAAFPEYLVH